MTEIKDLPNDIEQLRSMIVKRDSIIEKLQLGNDCKSLEEKLDTLVKVHDTLKENYMALILKSKDQAYKIDELEEIQKGDEQAKDRLHKMIEDKEQSPGEELYKVKCSSLEEKILLLEQQLLELRTGISDLLK